MSINIPSQEIHVWSIPLDQPEDQVQTLKAQLSAGEWVKAGRFVFAQDQACYVVAHGCLRLILQHYLDTSAKAIQFDVTAFGKPVICYPLNSQLHFNLSHSSSIALVAISSHPVGVDVEWMNLDLPFADLTAHFMSDRELQIFRKTPKSQQPQVFYRGWTRKEAYVKAIGKGLSYPIRQVTLSLDIQTPRVLADAYDPDSGQHWNVFHLDHINGYVGAVVGKGKSLKLYQYHCHLLEPDKNGEEEC